MHVSKRGINWKTHGWLFLTGLLVFFFLVLLLAYINTGSLELVKQWKGILHEGYLLLIGIIAAIYFVYYTSWMLDRKFFKQPDSIKRYLLEVVVVIVGGFFINSFFHFLFEKWVVVPEPKDQMLEIKLRNLFIVNQTLMIILYGVITGFKAFRNLKQKQSELHILEKEIAQTQFEALKNKLNPHFLFNSLSVLTSLVHTNPDLAEIFIGKLSKTYRYLLDQREMEFVSLSEEFEFLGHLEFLLKQRYNNKLSIVFDKVKAEQKFFLQPNTILILIDHILATSTMSASQPLVIKIVIENSWLIFNYQLYPKENVSNDSFVQFSQLKERYSENGKSIIIESDDVSLISRFKIPLIQKND